MAHMVADRIVGWIWSENVKGRGHVRGWDGGGG